MDRRTFIQAGLTTSILPLGMSAVYGQNQATNEKELYEIRSYTLRFRGNQGLLNRYIKEALEPALKRAGANHIMRFTELGKEEPTKHWMLLSYPNAQSYIQAQNLQSDSEYVKASADYHALPHNSPIYTRIESWLLLAFDGMPQMRQPIEGAGLFELRTYEGYSEDAVRRKIKMFNDEELPLFDEVKLHPVFFGEMLAGPFRPCLTYMLNFKDMAARDEAWQHFLQHPDWDAMKNKEIYAHTVSNIRKVFLLPAD